MANGQNDFYTLQSLTTLAASAGATTVVANGIQRALDINPRWLALAVAQVVCVGTVYFTHASATATPGPASDYFLAVVNGFLVYSTAAGSTAIGNTLVHQSGGSHATPAGLGGTARGGAPASQAPARRRRGFFTPWH